MRAHVDDQRCQGHTLCAMTAPEVFLLRDDDGHSFVIDGDVPTALEESVRAAASTCPELAIVLGE